MLTHAAKLFRSSASRWNRLTRTMERRRDFLRGGRRPRLERLEARQVMDATLHNIAAANIDVVQNDNLNNASSVTITASYGFNDFRIRGGNRGDYDVQIGDSALDDVAGGILITSIRNNGRDNGEVDSESPDNAAGVQYGISAVHDSDSGYFIPVHNTSNGVNVAANEGIEYNFDVSAAYFPYADGWIGGLVRNVTRANGGVNDTLIGSPGLTLGTHFINLGGGQSTIDLRTMGINSQTDGVLLVNHGKNENNFGMSRANADGTWTAFTKGHNSDGSAWEQDPVAFVYVPLSNTNVIAGKFLGGVNNIALQNAPFTVTNPGTGRYQLEIPGHSPSTGVLIISAEGGAGNNVDNPVSFAANGTGWEIQTRDLPNMGLQNIGAADAVVSFVFIPGPTPGVNVTPTTGLLTTEAGGTANFSVTLDTQPAADVVIDLSSSDATEGAISTNQLIFTPANWNVPQVVTITGVDDGTTDGAVNYSIVTSPAVSADPIYSGRDAANVAVTNADDEPGITVNPPTGLTTTEAGGTATFTVVLNTAPTGDVVIGLTSSNPQEGSVSSPSLTFTPANWSTPQTVTVTGVADAIDDGDIAYNIVTAPATSTDPLYNNFNTPDIGVTNTDDDTAGINVTFSPATGLTVTENGTTATYTVVLTSQPTANVTVNVASTDTTEGTVSAPSLLFTAANWSTPQTVTVTGVNDLTGDGDVAFSIANTVTTSDSLYAAIDPPDVAVTNRDNDPVVSLATGAVAYGAGMGGVSIDSLATVSDPITTNYNNYQLVVTLTANAHSGDRLEIRNYGTAAGQVGVAGSNVTFGGATIGTFSGGTGSTPLTITFNAAATPAAAQAVLRAITFRNVVANPPATLRTASIVINGLGGNSSNTVTRGIQVGLLRVTDLQEGVDRGAGVYNGQVDIQLTENNPNTPHPVGSAAGELLVDFDSTGSAAQILLKYNDLFGTGPNQIPLGATIVSAELLMNVINTGDAGTLHRMLVPWNENTDTWNQFGSGTFPRNTQGGVQVDDQEARINFDSQWGLQDGSGATGTGVVSVGVTNDLSAWAGGEVNEGWLITGWDLRTDGTSISPSEAANPLLRPRLKVSWLPPGVASSTFREGLNGYVGAVDTVLRQADPDLPTSSELTLGVDAPAPADASQTLLRFDNLIGTAPGQIPPGSQVHAATLILSSTTGSAQGNGGQFFPMLQAWDSSATWNSLVNGVSPDGIEAATTFTTQAGVPELTPLVQGSYNPFDVSADVQAWVRGTLPNNGWAILPWAGGSDGWFFGASDIPIEASRPTLKVFYTSPGISVTPTSGLFTSETGATATFTVQLDTQPAANVTIPLSSDDTTEGTVGPTSLTFTPANWNIPQTVTVTGVDDALPDGSVAYNIVTGLSTSTDPFYSGLDAANVSVSNSDNETAGVTVQPLTGLVTNEGGGTATFTIVLNTAPTANVTIGLSSSDATEGSVPASVVFTPANWSTPQTVTVTGVDDNQIDGPVAYTIITANTVSSDSNYSNLTVLDVAVTNDDNDVAAINVTPTSGLITTEAGGTATFTIVLATQPTANVLFDLTSSNTSEGSVNPGTITFTPANWNLPQTVTLTGQLDFVDDPQTGYTIITSVVTSADADYNGLNPSDVTATNVEPRPVVTMPEGTKLFGFGGPAVLVDFQATVADLDSTNFNTGALTVQTTAGGTADDRLEVRNVGTGAGQIGVSGSAVSFGGVNIGTIAGGVGTAPLVITLGSAATPAATAALMQAVTFRNVSTTFSNSARTVQVTLSDGSGNTSLPVSKTVLVGMRRATEFQEGNDAGNGVFTGAADIQLLQSNPDTAYPTGNTAAGLSVAGSTGTANSQVLLRFDNIFGNGPGQIPLGAIITSAYLDMDVNDTGQGPVFRRMLTGWDANTATWNSMTGGIQADDVEARTAVESTLNTATGNGAATGAGTISVGVTADLQAWSSGAANNGWALMPFQPSNTNAFIFSPSEAANIADRPKLRVEWIPGGAGNSSFRQGVNGYTDVIDTQLTETTPTTANNAGVDLFVDFTDNTTTPNATHVLLQFQNIIGGLAGQIPAGAKVYAAVLTLPGTGSGNTPGDGGSLHTMLVPWDATASWSTFSNGVQNDGLEATIAESARAGNETRNPNAQAGYNTYDVTGDVQAWIDGTLQNNGWAWLPWVSGSDGWAISSSEVANVNNRPMLTVYYEATGNATPVNTTPAGPISGFEDTNVAFTGGNAISVSDADAGTNNITTTVSVTGTTVGTFTATNGGGTATVTPSNGGATLTFVGPQAEINLALATLVFVPAPNRDTTSGATTVMVATTDGVATDTDTFNITLTSINDAPSFTKGADQAVAFNAPAQSITGWATAISPGPNESSQTVSFLVSNNMTALFTAGGQPAVAANGTLTFTPATGASGTATVTVIAQDTGGTANGGVNQSAAQTFTITINAGVNAPPTIAVIGNVTIDEDATLQTVNLSGISAGGTESQPLIVTAVSSNPAIVPNPSVNYTSPNATGSLSFTPVANQSGTVTITVTVSDPGLNGTPGDSDDGVATRTFDVSVNPINDRPTFTAANPPAVNEDAPAQSITGWVTAFNPGPNESGQTVLNYTVTNVSNPSLFSAAPSIATNGTLTYTPAANAHGTATFDVTVTDNGGTAGGGVATSLVQTFTITVNSVNDVPSFTVSTPPAVNEDAPAQTIAGFMTGISAGPSNESTQTLTFNLTGNTNSSLFSAGPSIASDGTLTYTPAPNASGSATITVTLSDNGGVDTSGSQTFTITVNSVNDAPSFTKGADQTIPFNSPAQTVTGWATAISAGPTDEAGQSLTFTITGNTNAALFAVAPAIAANGTLTYTPAAGQQGTATITVQLTDGGGTANGGLNVSGTQTFVITIEPPINLPPTLNPISPLTISEDAPLQTVNLSGITAGGSEVQDLQVTVSSSNPSLIPAPAVSYTTPAATGTLTFTPTANASGSSTITVTVRDAGLNLTLGDGDDGVTTRTFDVNVTPVNDPPVASDTTLSTLEGVALTANFSASDIDSSTLIFSISMPPVLGSISGFNPTNGAFTYTPAPGATGLEIINFTVSDGTSSDSGQLRINILPQTPVVTSTGGNINVDGTSGRDFIIVSPLSSTQALVRTQNPDTGYAASVAYALTGTISISTGAGNDRIDLTSLPNDSFLDAGADDDDVFGGVGNDTIIGGAGADKVNANHGNNVVWGDVVGEQDLAAGGDDILSSLGGNDVMYGGGGNDQLFPGAGNDFVNAGQGDDLVGASDGDDRVFGGQGNDVLSGDSGNDIVSGNSGNDRIIGSSGNDLLIGGFGTDDVTGGGSSDLLVAGELMNGFASLTGDANDLALIALLGNWNASHPAGLLSSLVAGDDGANDSLLGGEGDDDFYASVTDSLTDLNPLNMGNDRRFS